MTTTTYTMYHCDRCGAESKVPEFLTVHNVCIPIPTGHPSRVDCFDIRQVELCKACHAELQYWWKREKIPE